MRLRSHRSTTPPRPATRPPRRRAVAGTLVLLGLAGLAGPWSPLAPAPAAAATRLEGYYEAEIAAQKDDTRWHFGSPGDNGMPSHFAELKFWSNPSDRYEIFSRLWVKANRDDDRTTTMDYYSPRWIDGEGHLLLKQKKSELRLFYRQNHFWINDEPLLHLVDDWKLKNDDWGPKAQGVRYEFWEGGPLGVPGLGGSVIISDNGGTYSDDHGTRNDASDDVDVPNGENGLLMRLRHKAWNGRLESGIMFQRKDWTNTSLENWRDYLGLMHNDVVSADFAFTPRNLARTGLQFGPLNLEQSRWTVEAAWSRRPYEEQLSAAPRSDAYALALEARDMHLTTPLTVHFWYRDIGQNFRDYMAGSYDEGGGGYNRRQKHAEGIWLVPRKAVTAKVVWDDYEKIIADEPGGGLRPTEELYSELYLEFIKGFKARLAYKRWHGYDASSEVSDFMTYPDWFGEVSVENFLAKVRLQGRLHNAGTFRQTTAMGFDMQVNITDKLKGYLRALNVNEEIEARNTMYAEVKYDLGWGSELWFSYGDASQSDNLTYTWFVEEEKSDNLRDRFSLRLKAWF